MVGLVILGISVVFVLFFAINPVFAQESVDVSDQITISKDLENNPVAQDILKKIEKSKRWISQIEQRNFEALEKQKELEEKRAEVLQFLEKDLKKWEDLWGYYTFDKMLERALENSPAKDTTSIYDHPLKFTASKINAGRDALHKVILEGGGPEEARDAFVNAAKITRAEMISANSIYNIIHNNAYYNQQILFDSDGNFNLELSGEQLRKYYQDYRTNPSYLTANPEDMNAREELSRDSNTECRYGYALVYRIHAGDHVCVTEQTSEMWIRHGMGKLANVNQLENMDELTIEKLRQDRITEKIKNVNNQIKSAYNAYDEKLDTIQKNYDQVYANLELEEKDEEKKALANSSSMTKKTLSQRIEDIREQYDFVAENTRKEQIKSIQIMQTNHERDMTIFVSNFESISDVKVIWNSDISGYEVVRT
jgi:hypothetical protein